MMTPLQPHAPSYYDHLVDWQAIEQLLALVPADHHEEAVKLIAHAFDYSVLETVLRHLPEEHHHDFLQKCTVEYHQPELLVWLEERVDGVTLHIQQTITVTHQGLSAVVGVAL